MTPKTQRVGELYPKKGSFVAFRFEGTKSLLILKETVAFTNFQSKYNFWSKSTFCGLAIKIIIMLISV